VAHVSESLIHNKSKKDGTQLSEQQRLTEFRVRSLSTFIVRTESKRRSALSPEGIAEMNLRWDKI